MKESQVLLPFVERIERAEKALNEAVDEGRATIEVVLEQSARNLVGEKHPGWEGSEVRWPYPPVQPNRSRDARRATVR